MSNWNVAHEVFWFGPWPPEPKFICRSISTSIVYVSHFRTPEIWRDFQLRRFLSEFSDHASSYNLCFFFYLLSMHVCIKKIRVAKTDVVLDGKLNIVILMKLTFQEKWLKVNVNHVVLFPIVKFFSKTNIWWTILKRNNSRFSFNLIQNREYLTHMYVVWEHYFFC